MKRWVKPQVTQRSTPGKVINKKCKLCSHIQVKRFSTGMQCVLNRVKRT